MALSLLSSTTATSISDLAAFYFFISTILALRASSASQSALEALGFMAGPAVAAFFSSALG